MSDANTQELRGDPPYYTASYMSNNGRGGAYHTDPDCGKLSQSDVRRRDVGFIRWHDLGPCPVCIGRPQ